MTHHPGEASTDQRLRAAAQTVAALSDRLEQVQQREHEPIAITGMALRLPGGANSPDELWTLLAEGRDATSTFPADRGPAGAVLDPDPDAPGKAYTVRGGFLDGDVSGFDPEVFRITPREAAGMDPQQRLALELCWEALEDAGYAPDQLEGSSTGVWMGASTSDYVRMRQADGDPADVDAYQLMGEPSFIAGRISFTLGLRGPSSVLDTACSSSLVALHQACQSLRRGECDVALAGGVNLMLMPFGFVLMSKFRALAPDGRCKTFDAAADGYGRGEGGVVLALKRQSRAVADGDHVWALVRGTAVNHDGRSSGISVPNPRAQQDVVRAALADARTAPADVQYVEAHGTGTALGDPIELTALDAVLGAGRERPLLVGSVKSTIGHLEPAAGLAGLAKVVLALRHGVIPANLHLHQPNPQIPWDRLHLQVPTTPTPWPDAGRAVAGVSSFGVTGTNAHAVVAAPSSTGPVQRSSAEVASPDVLTLSARSPQALRELAGRWADQLASGAGRWADLAHTSRVGRARHEHGLVVTADSSAAAAATLQAWLAGTPSSAVPVRRAGFRDRAVGLLFTGQGSQHRGMARGLLRLPFLQQTWQEVDAAFAPHLGLDVETLLTSDQVDLDDTRWTQPALFAYEYVVARALQRCGVQPQVLVGHSIGEIAAATVAGVLSLPDAAALVARRGALMSQLPRTSGMLAVKAGEDVVTDLITPWAGSLAVAGLNGPGDTVVAGFDTALAELATRCQQEGLRTIALTVSHGFHSPAVDPVLDQLTEVAQALPHRRPGIPLLSNVTGQPWLDEDPDPAYWARHARSAVRFLDDVRAAAGGVGTMVEVGPHPTLSGLGQQCLPDDGTTWLHCGRRGGRDAQALLGALGALHLRGVDVDWSVVASPGVRRTSAPTYPWERTRHWFGGSGPSGAAGSSSSRAALPEQRGADQVRRPDAVLGLPGDGSVRSWCQPLPVAAAPDATTSPVRLPLVRVLPALHRACQLTGVPWRGVGPDLTDLHVRAAVGAGAVRWALIPGATPRFTADLAPATDAGQGTRWVDAVGLTLAARRARRPVVTTPVTRHPLAPAPAGQPWQVVAAALDAALDGLVAVTPDLTTTPGGGLDLHVARLSVVDGDPVAWSSSGDPTSVTGATVTLHDADGGAVAWCTGTRLLPATTVPLRAPSDLALVVDWAPGADQERRPHQGRVQLVGHPLPPEVVAALSRTHQVLDASTPDGAVDVTALSARWAAPDEQQAGPPLVVLVGPRHQELPDGLTVQPEPQDVLPVELSTVRLVRSLAEHAPDGALRVLTWSALAVAPDDQAPGWTSGSLWGLGRVAALEHPEQWAGLVDADPRTDADALAEALLGRGPEDETCLRPGTGSRTTSWVPRLVPAGAQLPSTPTPLPTTGATVVTGAYGGIGSLVCRWLAAAGVPALALVSRSGASTSGRRELLRELTDLGCTVSDHRVDVTDVGAVRALVTDLAASGTPVTGVVHSAGVSEPQDLVDVDEATYRRVWETKVLGAHALHLAVREQPVELFLCFSSIAATWGSQHLASYCAGNALLDALCAHRRAHGLAGTSLAWGPWDLPSELFGPEVVAFLVSVGLRPLDPQVCLELLDRLAAHPRPGWVVCDADWERYVEVMGARRPRPLFDRLQDAVRTASAPDAGTGPLAAATDPQASPQQRLGVVTEHLRTLVAQVVGTTPDQVPAEDLYRGGMDSLMVMEIASTCSKQAGVRVQARDLFERSSLDDWARLLVQRLGTPDGTQDGAAASASGPAGGAEVEPDDLRDPAVLAQHAVLPPDLQAPVAATAVSSPDGVLLTGATGFLGVHVLRELLDTTGARVSCVVRAGSADAGRQRLEQALRQHGLATSGLDRVVALPGDLSAPDLGLSSERWRQLHGEVASIVHNGASVNFAHTFEQLRATNVDSLTCLLRHAREAGNVPVHYVSTYGVWGLPTGAVSRVPEDGDLADAGPLVTGYTQTKWLADHLARQARALGQHVAVHRPGRVVCDSTGRTAMLEHFTTRVLKGCVELGYAPDLDFELEITPVDYVAAAIAALATIPASVGLDYHLINPARMAFRDVVAALNRLGHPVRTIPRDQWWQRLTAPDRTSTALDAVLPTVQALIIDGERAIDYDDRNARSLLEPLAITCPPLDDELLSRLVRHLTDVAFLPQPHALVTA